MTYNNCCQCFKKRDFEINTASNKRHIGNVKSRISESNKYSVGRVYYTS